jgi:hypothetical protein
MDSADHHSIDAAWRHAVESWLRRQGLITVSENEKVSPLFTHEK